MPVKTTPSKGSLSYQPEDKSTNIFYLDWRKGEIQNKQKIWANFVSGFLKKPGMLTGQYILSISALFYAVEFKYIKKAFSEMEKQIFVWKKMTSTFVSFLCEWLIKKQFKQKENFKKVQKRKRCFKNPFVV